LGIVKTTTDRHLQVELHAKAKIINVKRDAVKKCDKSGKPFGTRSDFRNTTGTPGTPHGLKTPNLIGNRTPAYGEGANTPYMGSATPMHGGSATPGYSGMTPRHGGETPHYGMGSHTPAYGGMTPAYGGMTPAYGGATPAYGGLTPAYGGITPKHGGLTPHFEGNATPHFPDAAGAATPGFIGDLNTGTPNLTNTPNFNQTPSGALKGPDTPVLNVQPNHTPQFGTSGVGSQFENQPGNPTYETQTVEGQNQSMWPSQGPNTPGSGPYDPSDMSDANDIPKHQFSPLGGNYQDEYNSYSETGEGDLSTSDVGVSMSDPPHSDSMGTHTDSGNETSNARSGPRDAFYFIVKNAELRYQNKVAIVEEVFDSEVRVLVEGNSITVPKDGLAYILPNENDTVKIVCGPVAGTTGELLGIDGSDAIVKISTTFEIQILPRDTMVKTAKENEM